MDRLLHGVSVFFDRLASVHWYFLALAVACHLVKLACVSRSWRNILVAAYPEARIRWRSIFGAYAAGAGINAILPARTGDAMKLYLARHRIPGSSYTTLASTLVVQTLFDVTMATALLIWAASIGALPGLSLLPDLPSFDFSWAFDHPKATAIVAAILLVAGGIFGQWVADHVAAFRERVARGFVALRNPRFYLTRVVPWQVADWTLRLVTIYWFLRAFAIDTTLHNALLVQVSQSLSTVLPFTPGGAGTEQALVVYALHGAASATALLGFSVGMKLTLILANVLLGFTATAVMLRRFRWRRPALEEEPQVQPEAGA